MIVVADTTPLAVLIGIGQIQILPALFGSVIIPPQVAAEMAQQNHPVEIRGFIASIPGWLQVRSPASHQNIPRLHAGETAAILLAEELKADLLLIDERQGRRFAQKRGIRITGTIAILEEAASAGLLDLADAFERVKQSDFWISHKLLEERLKRFQSRES